ncbi:MAG: tetraacyldisaccharide 4'-kinase [Bacteroidota bacterium]
MRHLQFFLYPASLLYGFFMQIRNLLFDWNILKSTQFNLPLISVGNLSVGGSGKTPQVEYLLRLLSEKFKTATLSRGYGRRSSGFLLATDHTDVKLIGDEPRQISKKFGNIHVAVDEKRTRGVQHLLDQFPDLNVVILDDSYQHRWVKPGLSILLSDYYHLYYEDHVIPTGRLREFSCGSKRADIIIITKTPKILSPITRRRITESIRPKSHQQLFFSYIHYLAPLPIFKTVMQDIPTKWSFILLFSGVADDELLKEHLRRYCNDLTSIRFGDHHDYSLKDIIRIKEKYDTLPSQKKIAITTEKDVMRLQEPELQEILKTFPVYFIPIEVEFHEPDKQIFDQAILNYVKENKRDG